MPTLISLARARSVVIADEYRHVVSIRVGVDQFHRRAVVGRPREHEDWPEDLPLPGGHP
nr:hypothetical protein [Jannaschia formosa]